jgi:hypothetical protein
MEPLLDTKAAARELTELGVRRSPSYLAKSRCIGTGPAYRILSGKPYYAKSDLVAWIEGELSPPRRSSSEPDQTPTAEPMPANHRSRHGHSEAAEASPAG